MAMTSKPENGYSFALRDTSPQLLRLLTDLSALIELRHVAIEKFLFQVSYASQKSELVSLKWITDVLAEHKHQHLELQLLSLHPYFFIEVLGNNREYKWVIDSPNPQEEQSAEVILFLAVTNLWLNKISKEVQNINNR